MALDPGVALPHPAPGRVLLVGAGLADARALLTAQPSGPMPVLLSASSIAEALAQLATQPVDVVVASHRLSDGLASDLLDALAGVALVVLIAPGDEASAALAFREAEVDVLVQDADGRYLALLPWRIAVALRRAGDRSGAAAAGPERKVAADALRASDQRLRDLVASTDGIVWEADADTFEFTSVSEYAERLLGYPVSDWYQSGFWASHIHPDDRESTVQYCVACTRRGESHEFEYRFLAKGGGVRWLRDIVRVVEEGGRPRWLRGLMVDITVHKEAEQERAVLEARLTQAQKLESIGRLAGGVAHDFNNMLSVILGHADLALRQAPPSHPLHQDLVEIQAAAQRSAALTRQMLAFARKQAVTPRVLAIDEAVAGMLSLLRRLVGEEIAVDWRPGASWLVWMDPSQLDQILTNLCVNARDAIGGVGTITVTTGDRTVREPTVLGTALPGDYVVVSVSDSGQGMDEATMAHIFEPFFTTKPVGAGTGLGLAMVDGAVRQNGGFVTVASRRGHGSTFEVFLPRHVGARESVAVAEPPGEPRPGTPGRILLVEDEPGILRLAAQMLEGLGYVVLQAAGPVEAMAVARAQAEPVDLLLTDVIMPAMNGQELAHALRGRWPHLEVLFMSGYTADVISQRGLLTADTNFLQKPFLVEELGRAVDALIARDTAV